MGLESATNINALNAAWPLGTDARSEGDDHLRMLKSVLKAAISDDGTTVQLKKTAAFIRTTMKVTSGAHTLHADTKAFLVEMVGAGGGGGTAPVSAASQSSVGGGGGAGCVMSKWVLRTAPMALTVTIGAGGAANATGGNTIYSDTVNSMTAGGGGGASSGSSAIAVSGLGGAGGIAVSGSSDFARVGESGEPGFGFGVTALTTVAFAQSGAGGSTTFGAGGQAMAAILSTSGSTAGGAGTGLGGGGAGSISLFGAAANSGGVGSIGGVIITEFR